VYNALRGDYLLTANRLMETQLLLGFYNLQIFTSRIDSVPTDTTVTRLVEDAPYGGNEIGHTRFALAYGPIQSDVTPTGRFLLAVQTNRGIN
jgi:hypothetical protein